MKVSEIFRGKFLKATDIVGTRRATISGMEMQLIGDDKREKPVLFFQEFERGLALNSTNANTLKDAYGDEMEDWIGKPVVLFRDKTSFQGRITDCLRVRIPTKPAGENAPTAESADGGDNW